MFLQKKYSKETNEAYLFHLNGGFNSNSGVTNWWIELAQL